MRLWKKIVLGIGIVTAGFVILLAIFLSRFNIGQLKAIEEKRAIAEIREFFGSMDLPVAEATGAQCEAQAPLLATRLYRFKADPIALEPLIEKLQMQEAPAGDKECGITDVFTRQLGGLWNPPQNAGCKTRETASQYATLWFSSSSGLVYLEIAERQR
jgi:hypothetical protein